MLWVCGHDYFILSMRGHTDNFYTPESDIILTYKDGPRAESVSIRRKMTYATRHARMAVSSTFLKLTF